MTKSPKSPRFLSVRFIICGAVLVLAAVGIRPGLAALVDAMSKESIDLRRKLRDFTQEDLPSFSFVRDSSNESWLSDFQELGTDEVVAYEYIPKNKPPSERIERMNFITYYSDPRETIPHTPDVCYRAGGATIRAMRTVTIETPELAPEIERFDARVMDILLDRDEITLIYALCVNGKVVHERERARLWMGLAPDDYIYFSKIEVLQTRDRGTAFEESIEPCKQLLAETLAVLVRDHYPRREDLRDP